MKPLGIDPRCSRFISPFFHIFCSTLVVTYWSRVHAFVSLSGSTISRNVPLDVHSLKNSAFNHVISRVSVIHSLLSGKGTQCSLSTDTVKYTPLISIYSTGGHVRIIVCVCAYHAPECQTACLYLVCPVSCCHPCPHLLGMKCWHCCSAFTLTDYHWTEPTSRLHSFTRWSSFGMFVDQISWPFTSDFFPLKMKLIQGSQ